MFKKTNKRIIIFLHVTDPDCYKLVSISEDRSSTKKEPPTTMNHRYCKIASIYKYKGKLKETSLLFL